MRILSSTVFRAVAASVGAAALILALTAGSGAPAKAAPRAFCTPAMCG